MDDWKECTSQKSPVIHSNHHPKKVLPDGLEPGLPLRTVILPTHCKRGCWDAYTLLKFKVFIFLFCQSTTNTLQLSTGIWSRIGSGPGSFPRWSVIYKLFPPLLNGKEHFYGFFLFKYITKNEL